MNTDVKKLLELKSDELIRSMKRKFMNTDETISHFSGYLDAMQEMGHITQEERSALMGKLVESILK